MKTQRIKGSEGKRGSQPWRVLAMVLALLLCALIAGACGGGEEGEIPTETESGADAALQTPAGQLAQNAQNTPAPSQETLPSASTPAALTVTQSVAYYFPETENLYAAIEYENTGESAAYVQEVSLVFDTGNGRVEATFSPMLAQEDFLFPGQKATLAYWRKHDGGDELTFDSPITLEDISIVPANRPPDAADYKLVVQDCTVIQNYPTFATLTGNVVNDSERNYALSLIYASFYDEGGQLIGVWHFTKNMAIQAESKRNFSVHLEALPIPDLENRTAEIVARGVGIE